MSLMTFTTKVENLGVINVYWIVNIDYVVSEVNVFDISWTSTIYMSRLYVKSVLLITHHIAIKLVRHN